MKYLLVILVLVLCLAGCSAQWARTSPATVAENIGEAMEMYRHHDIRFETGSVPGSFRVYQGEEVIGSTGSMTPEEWLGWKYTDDFESWVQANKDPAKPILIDIPEVDLDNVSSLTGVDVSHTMGVQTYYAIPGDTTWVKIHFKGWEPPPAKHSMMERIPLLGPEGNPNVVLMKFNDGEYESAYISKEAVRDVVLAVLAEIDAAKVSLDLNGKSYDIPLITTEEQIEEVVMRVLAEETLPPLRIVADTPTVRSWYVPVEDGVTMLELLETHELTTPKESTDQEDVPSSESKKAAPDEEA